MAYAPLPSLDDLNVREWNELTSTNEKIIEFCQQVGLIHVLPTQPCPKNHTNWYLGACAAVADKWKWRCRTCKSSRSLRDSTFFSQSRLSLQQILDLMMFWSQGLDSHKFLKRNVNILGDATIVDWKNFKHDLCVEYFIQHPTIIGGIGHIVEIDESAWTKRKYHRGRQIDNQWVFGGIDRDTRECFAGLVDRRDAATLIPIIYGFVMPGTTIYSDQWAAYNALSHPNNAPHRYGHQTVNHSVNFVDSTTLVHTQNIENMWMVAKIKKKNQMGQHRTLLGSHLLEFMWRRRFGNRPFANSIRLIQEQYPIV
ncbi:unnamed protein product [Rotaria magnacalcarata]|uniref:ISXO2-like transposase domain-containing protein n=1 Tax=Rotaria magnacalcarata TaxID=392030 RepID=A0A820JI41_9BILA|nr:unnamed protein product [Rotaria magnacalcarata]CAF2143294.1 unnamed protein product [Rotaria magnacalcarata]CAF4325998.1 unnamed protein product [Rotaria magnacalcarata]CAF4416003.1 unnamed protein product [Rotaria magnacalcarata]